MVLSEKAALEAEKREDLRRAAREQIRVLRQMVDTLERCIGSSECANGWQLRAVEREFEDTSISILKMAESIGHAAQLLKVKG